MYKALRRQRVCNEEQSLLGCFVKGMESTESFEKKFPLNQTEEQLKITGNELHLTELEMDSFFKKTLSP